MEKNEPYQNITSHLEEFLQNKELKASPESLQSPIDYMLDLPSKMVRPIMCYMSHVLFAEPNDSLYYACWSIEYFHNFTLMHDDIMDEALTRRGEDSVYKKYGRDQAILSGDAMMIQAYAYLTELNSDILPEVFKRFNQTALEVCQGQQMDMDFEKMDVVNYDEYLDMIRQKTAVLLAYSCWLGAINSTTSKENQDNLYLFGLNLGMAFQLFDDYLDAFAEQEKLGKKIGGDILMDKKTALYIKALESIPEEADRSGFIQEYLAAKDDTAVEKIKAKMLELGVDKRLKEDIQKYTDASLEYLKAVDIEDVYKESLQELAGNMLKRKF